MTEATTEDTAEIVSALREFLGEGGRSFFAGLHEKFGTVSPVCYLGPNDEPMTYKEAHAAQSEDRRLKGYPLLPHPVHFREGMQIRNFLRTLSTCNDWTSHDFDNRWAGLVERAIDVGGGRGRGDPNGDSPDGRGCA